MKKITKMFLILTFGMLVSCGSDDSSDSNTFETDIIGTWELISSTANGLEFFESTECQTLLTFTATTIVSTEFYDYEDGNGCVLDYVSDSGTYTLSGNILTGTIDDETATFEILELNATTLKIQGNITEEGLSIIFIQTFVKI